jgi:hypothetical protein
MLPAIAAYISFAAYAQKLDVSNVPAAAKASFAKQYPGVAARWEKENGKYEANFKQNGVPMSVLMDEKGAITETEMDIKVAAMPAAALSYVKEHYKGKTINECAKITKADGTVNYEAEVGGEDVIFDSNGKFLKVTKD